MQMLEMANQRQAYFNVMEHTNAHTHTHKEKATVSEGQRSFYGRPYFRYD